MGARIFQKSFVNQPNQGHQPWQSNSLLWASQTPICVLQDPTNITPKRLPNLQLRPPKPPTWTPKTPTWLQKATSQAPNPAAQARRNGA